MTINASPVLVKKFKQQRLTEGHCILKQGAILNQTLAALYQAGVEKHQLIALGQITGILIVTKLSCTH